MICKTAFFVDADYFLRQRRYHLGPAVADTPGSAARNLRKQCLRHLYWKKERIGHLYRIFVYDCPPITKKTHRFVSRHAIDFAKTPVAQFRLAFHQELRRTPNTALRLGYLDEMNSSWQLRTPDTLTSLMRGELDASQLTDDDFVYYARQKAVDMKLGLDVASLSYLRLVDRIVLIAGDSDFVPAAKLARREGIEFVLDPMWKHIKPDLQEHVDLVRSTIRRRSADGRKDGAEYANDDIEITGSSLDNKENP